MNLLYVSIVLCFGCVLAQQPTVELLLSQEWAEVGDSLTITCKTKYLNDEQVIMGKYVIVDINENGVVKPIRYTDQMTLNNELFGSKYSDSGRFTAHEPTEEGADGKNYKVTIDPVQKEDSANYYCTLLNTEINDNKLLEVYTQPESVEFTNFTNVDVVNSVINFSEGDTKTVECKVKGVVPIPNVTVSVGEWEYTRRFKHRENEVKLGCYPEAENCLLHFNNDYLIRATEFRPDYTADGKELICRAILPGSKQVPKETKLTVFMTYIPKFRCFPKQKVAIGTKNAELTCKILSNPMLKSNSFEFNLEGNTHKLSAGESTPDNTIRMTQEKINNKETEVKLTFSEIFDYHYDMKFKLSAMNTHDQTNSTILEWVPEDFQRMSASTIYSNVLVILLAVIAYAFY